MVIRASQSGREANSLTKVNVWLKSLSILGYVFGKDVAVNSDIAIAEVRTVGAA